MNGKTNLAYPYIIEYYSARKRSTGEWISTLSLAHDAKQTDIV